jgi:hypothetical protein
MGDTTIRIPPDAWTATGSDEDATSRLLCCLVINGTAHHLEAYAVTTEPDGLQKAADPLFETNVDGMYRVAEPDQPFQTITISGRTYVLALTPHAT